MVLYSDFFLQHFINSWFAYIQFIGHQQNIVAVFFKNADDMIGVFFQCFSSARKNPFWQMQTMSPCIYFFLRCSLPLPVVHHGFQFTYVARKLYFNNFSFASAEITRCSSLLSLQNYPGKILPAVKRRRRSH